LYENTLPQENFPSYCLFTDAERATARGSGPEACVITGGTPGQTRADGRAEGADAVLTSQVVTQRDAHILAARQIAAAFADGGPRPLLVVGGPRFAPAMAAELGVDRVFGRGTTPREVASYLVHSLIPEPQEAGR
jgi:methylmalonyl-CoA mutase cobalamin-binding subunit